GSFDFFKNYTVLGMQQNDDEKVVMIAEPSDTFDDLAAAEVLRGKFAKLNLLSRPSRVLLSGEPLPLSAALKVRRNHLRDRIEANDWPYRELYLTESAREKAKEEIKVMDIKTEENKLVNEISVDRIRELMSEVLLRPVEEISARDDFIHDLEADSLQAVSLLAALENEYDVTIEEDNFNGKLTAEVIADLLRDHKSGKTRTFSGAQTAAQTPSALHNPEQPAEDRQAVSDPAEDSGRIDSFEKSREFKAFAQREKGLSPIMEAFGNPYFVAHDSPLTDVSLYEGKEILNFGSYNYLAMSGDPEVSQAATEALLKYGSSASGSRILAGEKSIHKELEQAIARWKHTEDALVMVSGHATNVSFVGNFCNQYDLILYDVLSHNSIAQGLEISPASSRAFPHNDMAVLEGILERRRDDYEKVLVIVEGAYSMDGDVAPLPELVALKKKYGFFLMVDEAHSIGVLGEHGGGVDEFFNLEPSDIDIKMGTLSKTLGTCGGYLAGSASLIKYLRYNLPGFVFSVGLSPALAGAALKAIEIIVRDNSRVKALQKNIDVFMREAKIRGFETPAKGESAIVPIVIGEDVAAFKLSMQMLENGVFVPPAVYPAVPRGQARLRFCLTSAHKEDQIIEALDLLEKLIMAK
ncbi:MAG: aminotransferase class I/II-fold pyridoxal phosphate-dependent enzyme, partial [Eubacteriales bacterium]|nr:aminotransferase class I/II-fold pyridoxal phosphate-dependent enzyme [Eubacteriales bacterium]